jgi:hypothetical protein
MVLTSSSFRSYLHGMYKLIKRQYGYRPVYKNLLLLNLRKDLDEIWY